MTAAVRHATARLRGAPVDDPVLNAAAAVSNARGDVELARRLAARKEIGAADLYRAEYRLELALRALDRARAASRLPWLLDGFDGPDAA